MAIQKSYPTTEAELLAEFNKDIPYLNVATNKSRLVTTPAAIDALTKANTNLTAFASNYALCNNPNTSTTTTITNKNNNIKTILECIRIIIGDIPQSLLTQNDYDSLGLSKGEKTYTKATKPTGIPVLTIVEHRHLSIKINVADIKQLNRKAKPEDADGIELEMAFFAPTATIPATGPTDAQFNHIANSGKTKIEVTFKAEQVKGTIFLRARYYNTSKDAGAWSEYIDTIII